MEQNQLNIDDLLAKKYAEGKAFSAGIRYKIEEGRIYFLTVNYAGQNWFVQKKFPGGKSEDGGTPFEKGETPLETLEHEWTEETGRYVIKAKCVHHKILKDGHIQFFFLVEEDEEIGFPAKKKIDMDTSIPKWELATEILKDLYGQHKIACIKLIEKLSVEDTEFCKIAHMSNLLTVLKNIKSQYRKTKTAARPRV